MHVQTSREIALCIYYIYHQYVFTLPIQQVVIIQGFKMRREPYNYYPDFMYS